jgi:hypothetical protein
MRPTVLTILLSLLLLSACGNVNDKPLPMVQKDDPVFALTPDHLDIGGLPQ